MNAPITAYKGFNEIDGQLDCRGHRFVEGETYEHDGPVSLCNSGYHACLQPLHVLRYYKPGTSVFHVVQLDDATKVEAGEDSNVAARKITIGAKVSLAGLIEAQVEWVTSRAKPVKGSTAKADNGAATASGNSGAATASGWSGAATASGESGAATASGEYGAATASGWYGAATASGEYGAATASGNSGAATASGRYGAATASGNSGAATASGEYGAATASGRYGAATASGEYGAATASGNSGAATASGRSGAATVEGEHSVACATGANSKAAGAVGCVLLLIERDVNWKIVGHQSVMVDGATIKADTFYALRGGSVVEA
jgi:hypothetical protein